MPVDGRSGGCALFPLTGKLALLSSGFGLAGSLVWKGLPLRVLDENEGRFTIFNTSGVY